MTGNNTLPGLNAPMQVLTDGAAVQSGAAAQDAARLLFRVTIAAEAKPGRGGYVSNGGEGVPYYIDNGNLANIPGPARSFPPELLGVELSGVNPGVPGKPRLLQTIIRTR